MTETIESQGTKLQIGDGGTPETFSDICGITNLDGPDGQATVIDISNLCSTRREKRMGLADEGQISGTLFYDPNSSPQAAMNTARGSRERTNFRIIYTDDDDVTETHAFAGYVLQFAKSVAVDAAATVNFIIEIDGAITIT